MSRLEDLPDEAVALATAVARLIELDPSHRRAVADFAGAVSANLAMAIELGSDHAAQRLATWTVAMQVLLDAARPRRPLVLPSAEQALWEAAGANFDDDGAIGRNAVRVAVEFAELVGRSVKGDAEVARLLGVDASRISQRLREKSLYAFRHREDRYFPMWQFADRKTLPGLAEILRAFGDDRHPLVVDDWFTTPSVDLELKRSPVSPVTWLANGGSPSRLARFAADFE